MNILLVYPQYPDTYWSFKHALRFVSKKAAVPPLGLITVSAMLPGSWQKKLVDMNVSSLRESDIQWADYVFISAMYVQKESVDKVILECVKHNTKMIAGGPLFTQEFNNYPQIDHFILNEAEITLPLFLKDLHAGKLPHEIYKTEEYADLTATPVPDFHLLNLKAYATMNLQVSRGCPFACDFCEITTLLGHKVRMKSKNQIIEELERLYQLNWRGNIAIVDDNFIGRKKEIKNNLLPAMNNWMQHHSYPFRYSIQSSIDLADDEELMQMMRETGINAAFIGIETPDEDSLQACHKVQNKNRDLLQNVKKIQKAGLQVSGGFIVGFDSDAPSVFQRQIDFIQRSGIVSAMVGLLNAPKNTRLYQRLKEEDRLTVDPTGSNTDYTMNFTPKMNINELMEGYKKIIQNIYAVKPYYKRLRQFLLNYNRQRLGKNRLEFNNLLAFFKTVIIIGIINRGRGEYWKILIWTLFRRPGSFIDAVTFIVYGYHYRTVYGLRSSRLSDFIKSDRNF
jgi:radical SAM superfamily enzyme YgiQ (UPF0313 family)